MQRLHPFGDRYCWSIRSFGAPIATTSALLPAWGVFCQGPSLLSIHNMVDKSRSKRAYTLVNVDSQVAEAVLDSIARINGLLAVRYLPIVPRS